MQISLVTGGGGFIGSHIVRALLAQGKAVRVFDNFSTGKRQNLSGLSVDIIEGDIRSTQQVSEALRDVDEVYHQAAFISVPQSIIEPKTCFEINVQGTMNLFEAARLAGVRHIVIASSCAVYGDTTNFPIFEEEPLKPLSPYAASKQVTEILAGLYTRSYGLPVTALRYFNVYGPRQAPDSPYAAVIPIFLRRILDGKEIVIFGDGSHKRDFVYVEDVVNANLLAVKTAQTAGEVYNVCRGVETSLLEMIDLMQDIFTHPPDRLQSLLNKEVKFQPPRFDPPRSGDIHRSLGQPQKARLSFDFEARTSLRDGLIATAIAMLAG